MLKNNFWKQLVIAAFLGSMSYLLMYIAFPIIPVVPYMTLDFSGVPILVAFCLFGRKSGYSALMIKEVLHLALTGISPVKLVGVGADALALICLAELFISISQNEQKHLVWAIGISTLGMTIIMTLANYFIITPAYIKLLGMRLSIPLSKLVIVGVAPFNLIKGVVLGIISSILIVKMKRLLVKI